MSAQDLITLQNVRDWLNTTGGASWPTTSDALLARLVTSASVWVTSYLQRRLQPTSYAETYNGRGMTQLFLRNRPVISVSSLVIGTTTLAPWTTPGGSGYAFDADTIYVGGCFRFWQGMQNIAVGYRAGLQQSDVVTVPGAPYTVSIATLSRPWNSDQGVAYANGTALTPVGVTPAVTGTYQVKPDSSATAEYVFAPGDAAASVTITYGYTPEDVQQAIVEMVGEAYQRRNRIGQNTQAVGAGQATSFSQKDMNASIQSLLNPWRNLVPAYD